MKKFLIRLIHPGTAPAAIMSAFCTAALVYIFLSGQEETVLAYIVYGLTTYSFTALAIAVPKLAATIKNAVHKNKLGNRYMTDISYRVKISLHSSLLFNLSYAAFKLVAGIYYASFWYGADAIFYIVLSVARFLLLRHVRKGERDRIAELKKYRFCGVLIFVLNSVFIAVVYQIINHGMRHQYSGLLIYPVAMYTFYCITKSIVNVIRYRKYNNPVYSAGKALSLAKALVAMFALQTAMFASFNDDLALERVMNMAVGILMCCTIFAIAVLMVVRANTELTTINENKTKEQRP